MTNLILNCTVCDAHVVERDPDPYDSFCDDDIRVRCTKTANQTPSYTSFGMIRAREPYITVGCRPYRKEVECEVPSWCPLRKQEESN